MDLDGYGDIYQLMEKKESVGLPKNWGELEAFLMDFNVCPHRFLLLQRNA